MKTKIMAGVAIAAIAATGVVGGFAIANGGLNSGINAAATAHTLTLDSSNCGAYTDSTSGSFTYYGWTFGLDHAGVQSSKIEIDGYTASGFGQAGKITFPTCGISGAYYSTIVFKGLINADSSAQFKISESGNGSQATVVVTNYSTASDYSLNLNSNVNSLILESSSTSSPVTFASVTVTYYC
jgi:hypothetical protein